MMEKRKADTDNTSRRKWDREEYEEKAKQRDEDDATEELSAHELKRRKRIARDPLHQGIIVRRAELKSRDYELDLTSRLGKTQVITHNTPLNQQAGYYCNVCDCILRDSASYLDHINGKWHNRALGMSMRVEKSSVDQVRVANTPVMQMAIEQLHNAIQGNQLIKYQQAQRVCSSSSVRKRLEKHRKKDEDSLNYVPDGFEDRVKLREEEEAQERQERKQRRRAKKDKEQQDEEEEEADPDMMALMGFSGFGGSTRP